MTHTHEIIRTERGATKNSGSPMWRCQTADGQRVNVFQHSDPAKDTSLLFDRAGYLGDMGALNIGEALEWTVSPIRVQMQPDGDWWKVVAVEPRPDGAQPDSMWQPDLDAYRVRAHKQSQLIYGHVDGFDVIDLETTGLRLDDEIVAMAVVNDVAQVVLNTRVWLKHSSKLNRIGKNGQSAGDIHGLTAEDLITAPPLAELWGELADRLDGRIIVGYNVRFDLQMLDRNLSNDELPLPVFCAVWDVAQLVAEFIGNWNEKRGWFEMIKLEEACAIFGVPLDDAHDACADAIATLKLLKAMADADPETWRAPF